MSLPLPKIYIRNFAGLANRLEALNIAFAIQQMGKHQIVLDWPELDLLRVEDTKKGTMSWLRRLVRYKPVKIESNHDLETTSLHQTIDLRIFYGSAELLDTNYPSLAKRLAIEPWAAETIRHKFTDRAAGQPVVGIHLRRGDFLGDNATIFNPNCHRHVAVPTWWYLGLMDEYRRQYPGVLFFASLNGPLANFPELATQKDVFTLNLAPSDPKLPNQHASDVHAVADLFALACCSVVLATPVSSFSHIAINVLGPPATALVPVAGACSDACSYAMLNLRYKRLRRWNESCRTATSHRKSYELPTPSPPNIDWIIKMKL
ncbi:MAG: hypothetical protein PHI06_00175 [Desulfobulbaceae bacterium]|nr:hypothetical protein [Desulfobulbaceae bacterium]